MANDVDVKIGADKKDASKTIRSFKKEIINLGKEVRTRANDFTAYATAATAAGAAVTAAIVNSSMQSAQQLKNLAFASNTTVREFQKYAQGAKTVGIENDKLADIFKDMNDRIGDFVQTGAGPMVDFFDNIAPAVGVTAEQFQKLSGPEALQLYYTSLERANVSQKDMTFFMEAIASDATALIPLLKNGGAEFKRIGEEAEQLGLIINDVDFAKLINAQKTFSKAKDVFKAAGTALSVELSPFVEEAAERFIAASKASGGFKKEIKSAAETGIKFVGELADVIHGIRVVFKGVEVAAKGFGAAVITVFELQMKGIAKFVDFGINRINDLMQVANMFGANLDLIDPFSDSDFMKGLENLGNVARNDVTNTLREMHELAMQKMPSDSVVEFLNTVREESEKTAEATAKVMQNLTGGGDEDGEQGDDERKKKALDRIKDFSQRLQDIKENEQHGILQIVKKRFGAESALTTESFGKIFTAFSGHSKKMQKVAEAAGIIDATISMNQGIAAGLKLGWPLSIPAVAFAVAKGTSAIMGIKNAKSGGGGRSAGGGGGAISSPSISDTATQQPAQQGLNIQFSSLKRGEFITTDSIIDAFENAEELGFNLIGG